MTALPSTADISAALNSSFIIETEKDEDNVSLELAEVSTGVISGDDKWENISMLFQCSEELQQSTYTLKHDTLGQQDLFMVPIGVKEDKFEYEVIINRKTN